MISALKTRELNKNTLLLMEFGQLFKRRVESFQDVWTFDRLPYVDLTTKTSTSPDDGLLFVFTLARK